MLNFLGPFARLFAPGIAAQAHVRIVAADLPLVGGGKQIAPVSWLTTIEALLAAMTDDAGLALLGGKPLVSPV